MAISIGTRVIPTNPANVAAEKSRLGTLTQAQREDEIKDAKGVIGTQIRAGNVGALSERAAETLEAADITTVDPADPDL